MRKYLLLILILLSSLFSFSLTADEGKLPIYPLQKGLILTINSSINPATLNYLTTGFERVNKESWNFILIKMNTPGGLVSTTKDILTLFGESHVPVIVWVTPEGASATSAGAIISSGAHFLFMTPGTNIGAATPVTLTSTDTKDEKDEKANSSAINNSNEKNLQQKSVNDLVALVKSLGLLRGRNGGHFAEMIETAASFDADEAMKKGIINGLAHSPDQIFTQLNGKSVQIQGKSYQLECPTPPIIEVQEMDLGQMILNIFANPSLAYIIFLLGAALIYLEFQAAGSYLPGSLGVICLILAGIAFQVLPLNFGAFGLILLSFILFVLETYITSYGLITLAGLISLTFGSLFLFRTENSYMSLSPLLVFSVVAAIGLFIALMTLYWAYDAKKQGRLSKKRSEGDHYALQGKPAHIIAVLGGPNDALYFYQVKIGGEIWCATSVHQYQPGQIVAVKSVDGKALSIELS